MNINESKYKFCIKNFFLGTWCVVRARHNWDKDPTLGSVHTLSELRVFQPSIWVGRFERRLALMYMFARCVCGVQTAGSTYYGTSSCTSSQRRCTAAIAFQAILTAFQSFWCNGDSRVINGCACTCRARTYGLKFE